MKIRPISKSTKMGSAPWEWIPEDFDNFLKELYTIKDHCDKREHLVIYRGQSNRNWLLDSTFVRFCREYIFGIPQSAKLKEDFRLSLEHQQIVWNLLFYKFGAIISSPELFEVERLPGIDPWFEVLKRLQQYSEKDDILPLKGTFIMDWTTKPEVAIYFSNYDRSGDGAVWACDATLTGKTHQTRPVTEIFDKIKEKILNNESIGLPLIFHPQKQIVSERASNQGSVYFAQMDLRVDLSEIWSLYEREQKIDENVFIKLVLPATVSNEECKKWLKEKGVTRRFLFPDESKKW
jgi:hypothetical protein